VRLSARGGYGGGCGQASEPAAVGAGGPAADEAFYQPRGPGPEGDRYLSTPLTAGPWDPDAQHAGPPIALVATAIERHHPREDARIVRVTADILGPVPVAPVTVTTTLARPGRGVELLTGSLSARGRQVLAVRAWRIRVLSDDDPAPPLIHDGPPQPGPDSGHPDPYLVRCRHGYLAAMEWRFLTGAFDQPGPATAWLRMRHPLIAGQDPTPLARVLTAADSGNGISSVLPFARWRFVNPDLTVYLHRMPVSEWICLDAATAVDPAGVGLATAIISDTDGVVGRGLQILHVGAR
jgi:Thioesterase-like superfamily